MCVTVWIKPMQWESVALSRAKNVAPMKEVIHKFTLHGFLHVDCCSGKFSGAKECMLLPQHRWFIRCDLDVECDMSSLPQLAFIFAREVLNAESDITGDETVLQIAIKFVKATDAMDKSTVLMHGRR